MSMLSEAFDFDLQQLPLVSFPDFIRQQFHSDVVTSVDVADSKDGPKSALTQVTPHGVPDLRVLTSMNACGATSYSDDLVFGIDALIDDSLLLTEAVITGTVSMVLRPDDLEEPVLPIHASKTNL
jgi:hypothetical protein